MRAELILYATPVGPLADALTEAFERISEVSPTTAQTYPPHCTLTGFFHRDPSATARIAGEVARSANATTTGPVEVTALHRGADWIGLELQSSWLLDVTAHFVRTHRLDPGDDELRPKDWLHLSIAYGVDDLAAADRALGDIDLSLSVFWEVGLWQRHPGGSWTTIPHPGSTFS